MQKEIIGRGGLIRGIGLVGAALIVLNSVIGAGIFALPAEIAARAGALSPWLFLACGLLVITIVLTYAELASYFRDTGGPVLYTTEAFGPLTGFTTGWIYFLSRMTAFAANTTVLVAYLGSTWPELAGGPGRAIAIVIVGGALTFANYVGVKDGVRTVGLFTFFKLLPLLLLILLGLPYISGDLLFPAAIPKIANLGETTQLLIYAFVGFEAATIIAGESSRPRRDLPKALVTTVAATGLFYFLIVLVYIAVLPDSRTGDLTLVDLGRELAGPAGAAIITATAVFSIGGNLASNMLTVPRLTFALAERRLLPDWFGHVHARFRTPGNSILFLGVLATGFALYGSFGWLAAASSLTRLIVYVLCILALPVIRRRADPQARERAWRLKGGYLVPAIALSLSIWIATNATLYSWQVTGTLVVVGFGLYWLARLQRRT